MGKHSSYDLLIDLGTNGEMLLLNKEKGFATSTACGPVFDHVIKGGKYGSESIKVIANCVKRGLIDKTGRLADVFFDNGMKFDKSKIIIFPQRVNYPVCGANVFYPVRDRFLQRL